MTNKSKLPMSRAKTAYGLLSEVRALILAEPKRYNQTAYLITNADAIDAPKGLPDCGTVGCVAGWVATLKHPREFTYGDIEFIARKILGLGDEWMQLFSPSAVSGRIQTTQHARSGAAHIRRFQKKYAAQLKATRV